MKYKYYGIIFFIISIGIIIFMYNSVILKNNIGTYKGNEIVSEKNINVPGLIVDNNSIIIDYPIFINNLNSKYIDVLIDAETRFKNEYLEINTNNEPIFFLTIDNINSDNFDFLSEINKNIYISNYTFNFEKYNDDYNHIFQNINFTSNYINLDLKFSNNLVGSNNLIQTIKKINELGKGKIEQFSLYGEASFFDTYIMSKEELDILNNMGLYILSIRTKLNENIGEDYLFNYLKNSKVEEYFIYNKISKNNGKILNGIGEIIN